MNKKKLGKVTGVAAASFLIAGTTAFTAFAAMPSGTAVIGDKAYDLNYVNDPANEAEIVAAMQKANFKVYVKDFAGNWIVNETETALTDLSVIPAVEYKNAKGEVTKYLPKDGDIDTTGSGGVVTGDLKVESVSAINAKEIQVKFNQAVDATSAKDLNNYIISVNGKRYSNENTAVFDGSITSILEAATNDVKFSSTKNTVTFRLSTGLLNGQKFSIDVRDGVIAKDKSKKIARYTDAEHTFADVSAPKLLTSEVNSSNELELTFDEPIIAAGLTVTVDGVPVAMAAPSTTIGDYTVKSAAVLPASLRTAGTHSVSVYGATDILAQNPNTATILTGSFAVTADVSAPAFKEVRPVEGNDRAFDIIFTEPLKSIDLSKVVVKKGNYTFAQVAENGDGTLVGPTLDSANSTRYSVGYAKVGADGKVGSATDVLGTGYDVVRVQFGADALPSVALNPLYTLNETNAALTFEVDGYKDAVDLVGAKYSGSVTLTKDLNAPAISSIYENKIAGTLNTNATDADGKLIIDFNKTLNTSNGASVELNKVTVTDKDGLIRTVSAATIANGDKVELVLAGLTDRDNIEAKAPYTVNFAAGAVKGLNLMGNAALSTTVLASNSVVTPVAEAVSGVGVLNNVITITYNTEMGVSATTLANYTLDGVQFPTGTTISIDGSNKVVTITLPSSYSSTTISRLLTISKEVKTKVGSSVVSNVATKAPYTAMLSFTDNTKPTIVDAKYLVADLTNTIQTSKIKLVFSENLTALGSNNAAGLLDDLEITVNGAKQVISTIEDGTANDKVVTVVLGTPVNVAQTATIKVVPAALQPSQSFTIKDIALNDLVENVTISTTGKEFDIDNATSSALVASAKQALNVTYNGTDASITLPTSLNGTTISWSSSNGSVISNIGAVTRPAAGQDNVTVTLTATITNGSVSDTKSFPIAVNAISAAAPNASFAAPDQAGKVKLAGTDATMEYAIGTGTYTACVGNDEIAANIGDVINVRVKATAQKPASEVKTLTVAEANIGVAAAPVAGDVAITAGTATNKVGVNVATTLEYRVVDSSNSEKQAWTTGTGAAVDTVTDCVAGDKIEVRVKATVAQPASAVYTHTVATENIGA